MAESQKSSEQAAKETFFGCLSLLFFIWFALNSGFVGREVDTCDRELYQFNLVSDFIDRTAEQASSSTQERYSATADDARRCAMRQAQGTGQKHTFKEDWFGKDYSVLAYHKWDWLPW